MRHEPYVRSNANNKANARRPIRFGLLLLSTLSILGGLATSAIAQRGRGSAGSDNLSGTSWRLVKFQDNEGTIVVPDNDRAKYTISFGSNGMATVRVDCNRGSGSWKLKASGQLQFGSMSISRAKCAAGSLHGRIVREGVVINGYVIKDGHLFLSSLEETGSYELEPLRSR